jgi:hypothetical protein
MKKCYVLPCVILLVPGVLLAQAPELEESIYVVRQQNRVAVPASACDWALPFLGGQPLYSSNSSELYSVLTKNKNGSLMKTKAKVGTLLGCTAAPTVEYERVETPTADFGKVWQMTLNGKDYTVGGSDRLRTNPLVYPYGFPVPFTGMVLGTSTGTVAKSFLTNWPPVVVGSVSCTWLSDPSQDNSFDEVATCTISLYE